MEGRYNTSMSLNVARSGLPRSTYRTAALIWAATLLIASLQPARPANFHGTTAHHSLHFLGFGVLAFLVTVGFGGPWRDLPWPAVASFLYGLAIEFVQHWKNRMPVEWNDVRDDAVGVFVFVAVCHMVYKPTA
jgi:hypothetical protein